MKILVAYYYKYVYGGGYIEAYEEYVNYLSTDTTNIYAELGSLLDNLFDSGDELYYGHSVVIKDVYASWGDRKIPLSLQEAEQSLSLVNLYQKWIDDYIVFNNEEIIKHNSDLLKRKILVAYESIDVLKERLQHQKDQLKEYEDMLNSLKSTGKLTNGN